jgi:tRNA dimethylallyltransferase
MCTDNSRRLTPQLAVVVVLGATATGKTALALRLARRFNAEIINADSRYLYRGLDIGTAKPSVAERAEIPHHLVDLLEPTEVFSVAQFLDDVYPAIEAVAERGKLPLVVGGTPQYLRALLEGWRTPNVAPNEALRSELAAVPAAELLDQLRAVDPASAEQIGPNQRRLIRALEIQAATGRPASEQRSKQPPPYRFLAVGLRMERDALHARIADRASWMYAHGLLDEAAALAGLDPALPAMLSIGYPEARAVIAGELDVAEAVERTRFATHRYVRHQETWFRRFPDVHWFDSALDSHAAEVEQAVDLFLSDSQQ